MKASLQLRKPRNWQDFETLCQKLWGEIWGCPEIKKNGRSGQDQHRVDIYGVPAEETQYYGIQCKGKDDYSHKQLTRNEIDNEIKKAFNFQPPLKKFYFTTTAPKDIKIEEYVRKKDLENRKKGAFEIHLFSWEDIVGLIDENKQTYEWYLKSQNFKLSKKIKVTFENDSDKMEIKVPFLKKITHNKRPTNQLGNDLSRLLAPTAKQKLLDLSFLTRSPFDSGFNESYCRFRIFFENVGYSVIENIKVFLNFEGNFESVQTCIKGPFFSLDQLYNTQIENEDRTGRVKPFPAHNPLVQKDQFCSDTICLKPKPVDHAEVVINWNLISNDFSDEGKLILGITAVFQEEEETIFIDNTEEEKTAEEIKDIITYSS